MPGSRSRVASPGFGPGPAGVRFGERFTVPTLLPACVNRGWLHFALACLLGAGAVLAAAVGLSSPPLFVAALALGYGSYRLGAHAIDRVAGGVYERVGVEPNEDGTVGEPGEQSGWRYVGRVDYEPREEPEFAWDDDFWHEAETDGGEASTAGRTPSGDAGAVTVDPRTREACEVLGVEPDASLDRVRAAYRARVKETHPDRGGDREAFLAVQRAYEHLRSRR